MMAIRVEMDRGRPHPGSFSVHAFKDGEGAGSLTAELEVERHPRFLPKGHAPVFTVDYIFVPASARRSGVATKLYEAAAREACKRGARLGSTCRERTAYSNDFWQKQYSKGRADMLAGMGCEGMAAYVLKSCDTHDLSGLRRKKKRSRK